ncbi:MAG TPA: hypothetical protein VF017_11455 [Thermoanaerobaculia bacterium]|nr:hypothetical protein [Thermoanaerobaculia bacterium]
MKPESHDDQVHELAGGWITERKGMPIPWFLKLAYVGFSLFGLYYLFSYFRGEVDHSTRGALVRTFNETASPPGMVWIGALGLILAIFVAGLLWFALAAKGEQGE